MIQKQELECLTRAVPMATTRKSWNWKAEETMGCYWMEPMVSRSELTSWMNLRSS